MKLLIDGDLLVHQSTVCVEHDVCFDDRYHILMSDANEGWNILEDTLKDLRDQANVADQVIVFSSPSNFRKHLSPDYKSNRKSSRKPLAYWDVIDRVKEKYDTEMYDNIEADDTMGILLTQYPDEYILWTIDKDLKQIPGFHLFDDEVVWLTEEQGDRFFWFQTIAGDATDGYHGCPTIGKVRGERMAAEWNTVEEAWASIVANYEKKGLTASDALYNARMARILRHGEYKDGKPILWTPPTT